MKLRRLQVEQLRQFRQPFVLDDLQPGLNLIHGPNESGKSTLVRAIRAAFFERYRTSSVDDLRPWGDSAAAPTITLDFEARHKNWHLVKSFLQRKRCDLRIDSDSYSEDEAEEKLAELLGFQFSAKGVSKPEHWGVPGLLWVEQGTGQNIEQAVEHAGDHLKSALNSLEGEVASTGGDELIEQVKTRWGELFTPTGKPRGDYQKLEKEREEHQQEINALQARVQKYQEQVDRLGKLAQDYERTQHERPWEEAERQLEQAREQVRQNQIDALAVKALKETEHQLKEEAIRSQTIATRLTWQLEPNATLALNDEPLEGQGEKQLLEETSLVVPGVGTLGITPGGEDLASTRRKLSTLEQSLAEQMEALSVDSTGQAEHRLTACEAVGRTLQHTLELLKSVAPVGMEQLLADHKETQSQLQNAKIELQNSPAPEADQQGQATRVASAETARTKAETRLAEAETEERKHQTELLTRRLAYADLLREAGRPTLVILDDTLVHSDTDRLDDMKRILFDAANRHQILLFTCHPEKWSDLGVVPRDILAMKEQGSANLV
jgi:energy-coupling factor transporter ATP-binding protein EcfA2